MKTGIFIYSQKKNINNLKLSLYFLFKNYNSIYKHNIYILYDDYDNNDIDEIKSGIRSEFKYLLNFKKIDLYIPENIDNTKLNEIININFENWGHIYERKLNHFWLFDFWEKIGKDFDYILKLDDDLLIEEPIREDLFNIIDNRANNILFSSLKYKCPIGSFSFKNLLETNFSSDIEKINNNFTKEKINELYNENEVELFKPIVPSDSFILMRTSFFTGNKIKPYLDRIKLLGYVFYLKWDLNLILPLLGIMHDNDKITRCIFKISKEIDRYSIYSNNKLLSNNLSNYKESGCISKK
jgi:hypothetical protein